MTVDQMLEIFYGGLQLVIAAYMIGLGIGVILRLMWKAAER